ncbi:SDR family oxidoreductase [Chitinimonas lacunae]|uniref:SDR family oxidoreductase n=1 Tax=Chitinimonas lacunae TaxID=1963018 RepID=A0ABV8MMR7_9NEIS
MDDVVIITGGGRGIGAATARLAAQRGYRVCINYLRDREAAESLRRELTAAGTEAIAVAADVSREDEVERLFAEAAARLGPLTALVNNAAILATQCRVEQIDTERLRRLFDVNVIGAFLCAREAVRRLSTVHGGRGGAIVNLSSVAAKLGAAGEYVDYAATKGAIDTFTLGLAREVAAEGIRVNAVRPGFIFTDIHALGGEPQRVVRMAPSLPMQRGGQPAEVAEAVLWLLSPQASYVTGSFIDVAGGR